MVDKALQGEKALTVWDAVRHLKVADRRGLMLIFDQEPELMEDREGNVIGVDAMVRAFRDGHEIRIDPHRRFFNPPTWHDGQFDPRGAYLAILFDSIENTPYPRGWRTKGTVDVFFSDAADGGVDSDHPTYATCRAGASLDTSSGIQIGQDEGFHIYEAFVSFDTSTIDDGSNVTAVELSLYSTFKDSVAWTVNARLHDWGATLTTADWVAGADLSSKTLLATKAISAISTSAHNAFVSESAFVSNVNLTGFTYIVLSSSKHEAGTEPTDSEFVVFSSSSASGTTQDPKLTVTYSDALVISADIAEATAAVLPATIAAVRITAITGEVATATSEAVEPIVEAITSETITAEVAEATADAIVPAIQSDTSRAIVAEVASATTAAIEATIAAVRTDSVEAEVAEAAAAGVPATIAGVRSPVVIAEVATATAAAIAGVLGALAVRIMPVRFGVARVARSLPGVAAIARRGGGSGRL